jgi:hypothetical protein
MNTSPVIIQALVETRQRDLLARARQAREARIAREARQARRAPAEAPGAPGAPVRRIRLTLRPWVLRGAI